MHTPDHRLLAWKGVPWVGASLLLLLAAGALYFFTGAAASEPSRTPPPGADDISFVLFAILLPTTLIGTFASDAAVCNTTMKPTMLVAGGLAIAARVLSLVVNELKRDDVVGPEAGRLKSS